MISRHPVRRSKFGTCTVTGYCSFTDLYTNNLVGDATITLRELSMILSVDCIEVDIIFDLYNFCNYFNEGRALYKQVKGVDGLLL